MEGETWRERSGAGGRGPGAGEGAALRAGLFSSSAGLRCHRESTTCVKFPEREPKLEPESGPRDASLAGTAEKGNFRPFWGLRKARRPFRAQYLIIFTNDDYARISGVDGAVRRR